MEAFWFWILMIALTVAFSTVCDTLSTMHAKGEAGWPALVVMIVLAPIVFYCFGRVGQRSGLSMASSITNSLVVVGPLIIGLLFRGEWKKMTPWQWIGMVTILVGIGIVLFLSPPDEPAAPPN